MGLHSWNVPGMCCNNKDHLLTGSPATNQHHDIMTSACIAVDQSTESFTRKVDLIRGLVKSVTSINVNDRLTKKRSAVLHPLLFPSSNPYLTPRMNSNESVILPSSNDMRVSEEPLFAASESPMDTSTTSSQATSMEEDLDEQVKVNELDFSASLQEKISMLSSQVETLTIFKRQCENLTAENKILQSQIEILNDKLVTDATAPDAMTAKQGRSVESTSKHDMYAAACTQANSTGSSFGKFTRVGKRPSMNDNVGNKLINKRTSTIDKEMANMEQLQADVNQLKVSEIIYSICYLVEYLNRTSLFPQHKYHSSLIDEQFGEKTKSSPDHSPPSKKKKQEVINLCGTNDSDSSESESDEEYGQAQPPWP